ncbi:MAG TPA: outer membrane lipoprotein carrier protein LolA [Candidatus Polarisedimenticolaceae bacterium]|nr:outer membrane lipoprotein carrier protein LolA [Candidatus Polarisedimenticolaceae bacterium]
MSNGRHQVSRKLSLLVLGSLVATAAAADDDLDRVLARFDDVQGSIQSLSADFTLTTTNQLLLDPIAAQGRFYMTKPDSIRWEYSQPEEMRFVIFGDQYTGFFPEQKRAERKNIQRWREHIFRFFGFGQGTSELRKFYDISLDPDHDPSNGTYLLILEPSKKRVRKRIPEVRFWVDRTSYLPAKVEYVNQNGNTSLLELRHIQVNPDLAASTFQVEVPRDFKVTKGFSGLPDFDTSSGE